MLYFKVQISVNKNNFIKKCFMPKETEKNFHAAKEMFVRPEFFDLIKSGAKTLELRIAFNLFSSISEGDRLLFKSGNEEPVLVEVVGVRKYKDLGEVLLTEDIAKLAPGMSKTAIQNTASALFNPSNIKQYGFLILEFKKVE